jgi:hypothetical protein
MQSNTQWLKKYCSSVEDILTVSLSLGSKSINELTGMIDWYPP